MEANEACDILFGNAASQSSSGSNLAELSEDDLLFADVDDTLISLDIESPLMEPLTTECQLEDDILFDDDDYSALEPIPHSSHIGLPPGVGSGVISQIECILEHIVNSILAGGHSTHITLKSRPVNSRRLTKVADNDEMVCEPKLRRISFPGATSKEAWTFTVLLRILELIHTGLMNNTSMTKRDLYYRHPDLFVKQSVVDRYIDDLAFTLGCTRSQLNISAAAKGLIAGNFSLIRKNGQKVESLTEREGILVPSLESGDHLDLALVRWVLIIEKEATFRSLTSSPCWQSLQLQGIILTAKGYPDLASRKVLHQIVEQAEHIPILALVDFDPDGLAILSTYKYGSYRLAHEIVAQNDTQVSGLSHIRWLGIKSQHISQTSQNEVRPEGDAAVQLQGLMRLTSRDRNRATRMLEWDLCAVDGREQDWRRELQTMLMLNVKAEMQILDELPTGLVPWIIKQLEEATAPAGDDHGGADEKMLY
ncbi:endodeoxyribonuclease [Coniothyrium glycines]